jgi:tRNA A37 N6-isopentenylltransferase MiaA
LSNAELYKKLYELDPQYAIELHENNRPYVERGIEIILLTGKSKREFRSERILKYDIFFLNAGYKFFDSGDYKENQEVIFTPQYRQWLYNRINSRVEHMFQE